MSDGESFEASSGLGASPLLSVLLGLEGAEFSDVVLLFDSWSLLLTFTPHSVRPGCGDAEPQELGLIVLGVLDLQVAPGARKHALSPPESFLSDDFEYGLKLDLSSTPMSLILSGLDFESLSEVTEESLAEDESDFPIWEHVCASRARGLFLASSC